ncbi:chitinase [Spizellomyces sp. 'palustris']|nr:chitinase [Spizellomyces sp. 'palustris']
MTNRCTHKVWPALQGKFGDPVPADGGFGMAPGTTVSVHVPYNWESGRIWPRTGCKINNGKVFCETGTCGIKENGYGVQCKGNGGVPPYTIVEFTLHGYKNLDYYDLSQVDGHNIGIAVAVVGGDKINDPEMVEPKFDCGNAACRMDISKYCPPELAFMSSDGKRIVACGSIHNAVEDLVQRTLHPDPLKPLYDDQVKRSLVGCTCDPTGTYNHCYAKVDKRPEAEGKRCYVEDWPAVKESGPWPSRYDKVFKDRCAREFLLHFEWPFWVYLGHVAYSWQFDDFSSTFNCRNADYHITFCPGAECGKEANGKECPNNACCSSFGTCGVTEAECGDGCQSNCNSLDDFPGPGACASPPLTIVVGYYSNTAYGRGENLPNCKGTLKAMAPEDLRPTGFTHLNYVKFQLDAFGAISANFKLATTRNEDDDLIKRFNGLKGSNGNLKTLWSIGGWAFNNPGSGTETRFSDMVSSPANRAVFIGDIVKTIPGRGFDGIDFDWEYPGPARGGRDSDPANFVQFLKELRQAFDRSNLKLIITVTAPPTQLNLADYDLKTLKENVDWINLMTYDFHGASPAINQPANPVDNRPPPNAWGSESLGVQPHANKFDIDNALRAYLKAGVPREKLVMGIAFYGRSYTLMRPDCVNPGCPYSNAGKPGVCTNVPGFLSYSEVQALDRTQTTVDKTSMSAVASSGDQWISYENHETIQAKMGIAAKQCLPGVAIWSLDLDPDGVLLLSVTGNANTATPNTGFCTADGRWRTTAAGQTSSYNCPYGEGSIVRHCGSDGRWGDVVNNCDDVHTEHFADDFKNCKNGPDVGSTIASLNLNDITVNAGSSGLTRRQRPGVAVFRNSTSLTSGNTSPNSTAATAHEQPLNATASTSQAPGTARAAAAALPVRVADVPPLASTLKDLWDLMKYNPAGVDLPYAAGIFANKPATPPSTTIHTILPPTEKPTIVPPSPTTTTSATTTTTPSPPSNGECRSTNCGVYDAMSERCSETLRARVLRSGQSYLLQQPAATQGNVLDEDHTQIKHHTLGGIPTCVRYALGCLLFMGV